MAPAGKRTTVPGGRQSGEIIDWKGEFGWIKPSKPINHPQAQRRGGKVYLSAEDVTEELDGVGATVSFTLYSDSAGLGAADVKMAKATQAQPQGWTSNAVAAHKAAQKQKSSAQTKPATKPAAAGAGSKPAVASAAKKSRTDDCEGSFLKQDAAFKAAKTTEQKAAILLEALSSFGVDTGYWEKNSWEKKEGKGKSKGKGKGSKGKGKGKQFVDEGEREMLHDEPLTGVISQWKGKFGWITPHDTIEHPLAGKHNGDLYVKQGDIMEEISGEGAEVTYMLYQDGRGLGACEVRPA